MFSESPCELADSEIRSPIAPKSVAAYQRENFDRCENQNVMKCL